MLARLIAILLAALVLVGPSAYGLAAEDGHPEEDTHVAEHGAVNPNPITVDPDLAIVTLIIFVVLLAVLWKFAWGPILDGLNKREKGIADDIAQAQRTADEAKQQLAQYETQLAGAASEVRELLDQARRDADAQKQQILDEAQQAAKSETERAKKAIEAAKNEALGQLAERSVDTAVELAGKILRRQLSTDDHTQLIQESLKRFPSNN